MDKLIDFENNFVHFKNIIDVENQPIERLKKVKAQKLNPCYFDS